MAPFRGSYAEHLARIGKNEALKISRNIMDKNTETNANDFKVVEFFNSTSFDFTPELGAMYDSRPFFVKSGERKQYPYHVGHLLAKNLAKVVLTRKAPTNAPGTTDQNGTPLWNDESLESIKNSFLTELYIEEKAATMSETDKLMAKVAELERLFKDKAPVAVEKPIENRVVEPAIEEVVAEETPSVYLDKAEVIAELEARGIPHDKRSSKATLEALLA